MRGLWFADRRTLETTPDNGWHSDGIGDAEGL